MPVGGEQLWVIQHFPYRQHLGFAGSEIEPQRIASAEPPGQPVVPEFVGIVLFGRIQLESAEIVGRTEKDGLRRRVPVIGIVSRHLVPGRVDFKNKEFREFRYKSISRSCRDPRVRVGKNARQIVNKFGRQAVEAVGHQEPAAGCVHQRQHFSYAVGTGRLGLQQVFGVHVVAHHLAVFIPAEGAARDHERRHAVGVAPDPLRRNNTKGDVGAVVEIPLIEEGFGAEAGARQLENGAVGRRRGRIHIIHAAVLCPAGVGIIVHKALNTTVIQVFINVLHVLQEIGIGKIVAHLSLDHPVGVGDRTGLIVEEHVSGEGGGIVVGTAAGLEIGKRYAAPFDNGLRPLSCGFVGFLVMAGRHIDIAVGRVRVFAGAVHLPVLLVPPALLIVLFVRIGHQPDGYGAVAQEARFHGPLHLGDRTGCIVHRRTVAIGFVLGVPKAYGWESIVFQTYLLEILQHIAILLKGLEGVCEAGGDIECIIGEPRLPGIDPLAHRIAGIQVQQQVFGLNGIGIQRPGAAMLLFRNRTFAKQEITDNGINAAFVPDMNTQGIAGEGGRREVEPDLRGALAGAMRRQLHGSQQCYCWSSINRPGNRLFPGFGIVAPAKAY